MTHGLQYQVSYTFSKCMSDSTGYYGAWNNALSASAYWQNVYDQRSDMRPVTTMPLTSFQPMPFMIFPLDTARCWVKMLMRSVDGVIGGWEVSPIVSFRTGFPMPVYGASGQFRHLRSGSAGRLQRRPNDYQYFLVPGYGLQWFTNNGNFTTSGSWNLWRLLTAARICVRLITATST